MSFRFLYHLRCVVVVLVDALTQQEATLIISLLQATEEEARYKAKRPKRRCNGHFKGESEHTQQHQSESNMYTTRGNV